MENTIFRILFLCVENSARSQMAEGLAKQFLDDKVIVESAGSNPGKINPLAISVMKEIGIDISQQKSKSVNAIESNSIDWIITLCAEEVCPYVYGRFKKEHWPFPNPSNPTLSSEEQLNLFRQVRDRLKKKILKFRKTLEKSTNE